MILKVTFENTLRLNIFEGLTKRELHVQRTMIATFVQAQQLVTMGSKGTKGTIGTSASSGSSLVIFNGVIP